MKEKNKKNKQRKIFQLEKEKYSNQRKERKIFKLEKGKYSN